MGRRIHRNPHWKPEEQVTDKSDHVIHPDGTYTNKREIVEVKPKKREFAIDDFVKLGGPYKSAGFIYQITPNGFYTRPSRTVAPDLSTCRFWPWDYVKEHLIEESL